MDSGGMDIGSLIDLVSKNPELVKIAVNLLSGMKSAPSSPPPESKKNDAPDLSALLGLLGGRQDTRQRPVGGIFSDPEENRKRIALLNAVSPYLGDKRREIMETVIKLMKLSEPGGLSSLLGRL